VTGPKQIGLARGLVPGAAPPPLRPQALADRAQGGARIGQAIGARQADQELGAQLVDEQLLRHAPRRHLRDASPLYGQLVERGQAGEQRDREHTGRLRQLRPGGRELVQVAAHQQPLALDARARAALAPDHALDLVRDDPAVAARDQESASRQAEDGAAPRHLGRAAMHDARGLARELEHFFGADLPAQAINGAQQLAFDVAQRGQLGAHPVGIFDVLERRLEQQGPGQRRHALQVVVHQLAPRLLRHALQEYARGARPVGRRLRKLQAERGRDDQTLATGGIAEREALFEQPLGAAARQRALRQTARRGQQEPHGLGHRIAQLVELEPARHVGQAARHLLVRRQALLGIDGDVPARSERVETVGVEIGDRFEQLHA
jgi:hypothetical protein